MVWLGPKLILILSGLIWAHLHTFDQFMPVAITLAYLFWKSIVKLLAILPVQFKSNLMHAILQSFLKRADNKSDLSYIVQFSDKFLLTVDHENYKFHAWICKVVSAKVQLLLWSAWCRARVVVQLNPHTNLKQEKIGLAPLLPLVFSLQKKFDQPSLWNRAEYLPVKVWNEVKFWSQDMHLCICYLTNQVLDI